MICGKDIRRLVIETHYRAGAGHIGCSLSVSDIIAVINPGADDESEFVLSKGHAASALYAALALNGAMSLDQLQEFGTESLKGHPDRSIPGVRVATGSLGMGLSIACGLALSDRDRRVYVLISDAELNEGSTWEALMFAGHNHLRNLYLFVDLNGQQATGRTQDIIDVRSIWSSVGNFGWNCLYGDGHNAGQMRRWLEGGYDQDAGKPNAYVAWTVFGKGVPFMENNLSWHYRTMTEDEYRAANAHVQCD